MLRVRLISYGLAGLLFAALLLAIFAAKFSPPKAELLEILIVSAEIERPPAAPPAPPTPPPKAPPPPKKRATQAITPTPIRTDTPAPPAQPPVAGPTAPAAPVEITDPNWIKRPNGSDFERYYPTRAFERGKTGRVMLHCRVELDGALSGCRVESEEPQGLGFGKAALDMSKLFRMHPLRKNGEPAAGGQVRVPIEFAFR